MTDLNLPKFNIPELPQKRLLPEEYHAWVLENIKLLHETGKLEQLRNQLRRSPVGKRFRL